MPSRIDLSKPDAEFLFDGVTLMKIHYRAANNTWQKKEKKVNNIVILNFEL